MSPTEVKNAQLLFKQHCRRYESGNSANDWDLCGMDTAMWLALTPKQVAQCAQSMDSEYSKPTLGLLAAVLTHSKIPFVITRVDNPLAKVPVMDVMLIDVKHPLTPGWETLFPKKTAKLINQYPPQTVGGLIIHTHSYEGDDAIGILGFDPA